MSTASTAAGMSAEIKAQLHQTLADLAQGVRDPGKVKAACGRMDQMREEHLRLFGDQNVAVELIRESRDRS